MCKAVTWVAASFACTISFLSETALSAPDYPKQPVQIVVGSSPGGGTDTQARLIAQKLSERWGQQVIVLNRPGADFRLAADFVARAKPDGYTLFMMVIDLVLPPPKGAEVRYDIIQSFAPIGLMTIAPNCVAVHPSVPVNSVKELIELARAQPNKLNFSGLGDGPAEVGWKRLLAVTGTKMEFLRYPGSAPANVALIGGEAQVTSTPCANLLPHMEAGKVKILSVTNKTENPALAKIPTHEEATGIKGYDGGGPNWYGLSAPAGTPSDIIAKIHDDVAAILRLPEIRQRFANQNITIAPEGTSEDFGQMIKREKARWQAWHQETEAISK